MRARAVLGFGSVSPMRDSGSGSGLNPEESGLTGPCAGSNSRQPLSRTEVEFARELFELHRLSLYRYLKGLLASREDATDILQETYLRLLRQPSFEPLRRNARAYLFQTATNLARDFFRRRTMKGMDAESQIFAASGLDSPDWSSWPEFALEGEMIGRIIVSALRVCNRRFARGWCLRG